MCRVGTGATLSGGYRDLTQATLHESIENQKRLSYESMGEITQATLISARLGDWPDVLALAGQRFVISSGTAAGHFLLQL
jgi:hypothetical protein